MAQNDPADRSAHWLFAALIGLIIAATSGVRPAFGMLHVDVFEATVPTPDRAEAAQTGAFQAALRVVLGRATGNRNAGDDPAFAPLLSNARRYVQQYRTTSDNQLWVAFDGAALERWLTQNGQPLWGRDRPTTLVWLSVGANGQPLATLSAEDNSELKTAIDAGAALRGIPLIWPSAEAAAASNPADLAHRLGAEGVLIGHATGTAATVPVRWTFTFQDRSSEFSGTLEGVNHAADLYASLYAASGALAPLEIEVAGFQGVKEYAAVQSYLESLSFVTHVAPAALNGDTVRFRLTTRGGIEALQHVVALSGRLRALPAGEEGIARFEVQR